MANFQEISSGNSAESGQPESRVWMPLLAFILFATAITLAGYAAFLHHKESIKTDKQNELSGIAELKIRQIDNWMEERRGDAQALRSDQLFLAEFNRWLQQGGPAGETKTKLLERLASLQQAYAAYGYTSISLYDDRAMLRLSSLGGEGQTQEHENKEMLESMRSGKIIFSDIHPAKRGNRQTIEIDLVAPLFAGKGKQAHAIGTVLFHIDPRRFLFPLIQLWPTPSASAENLLVRREGDEVVILNELRHSNLIPMPSPLSQQQLLTTKAVEGQEGLAEGMDYRGVPVIGVLSKIPGTSWFMISKIDKAEIYAPINQLTDWIALLMLSLVGTGSGITAFLRRKEKKQYASELERRALAKHLDYLAKFANDIILLLDSTGKIIDFNDRALEAYGYSAEELSGMNISDLRAIDFTPPFTDRFKEIDLLGALRFESIQVRRNGECFPIETSVRRIDIAGEKFYQGITRDITERKRAEEDIAQQKRFIRQVIDSDPNMIFVKDDKGRILLANETMAKLYGQTTESIIGKCNRELTGNAEDLEKFDLANRDVIEKRQERIAIEMSTTSDGKRHAFQTIRKPLVQDDGSISILTVAMDITQLKDTEERLQANNRALRLLSACDTALVHISDEKQLLAEICKLVVETGSYHMAWIGMAEHGPEKNVRPVAQYGFEKDYLAGQNITWADTAQGCCPTGWAIRTGITQVNQSFLNNPLMEPWRTAALERGYQSSIALPLRSGTQTFGVMTIYSATPDSFNTAEVTLLEELADNLAWGIMALRMRGEHEQAIEKLRQSEEHFRFLTENATDMTYLMSLPDGRYNYVSPSSKNLTGYAPEEFYRSPRFIQDIIHPDDHAYCEAQWKQLMAGEVPAHFEFRITSKSGDIRWMQQRNAPIWKSDGSNTLIAIQGVVTDVTEQKLAEEQLQFSNALLATAHEVSIDGMLVVDTNGKMISFNRQFVNMWGIPDEIIESRSDERAMKSVLDKIVDPEKFLKKVWHLYVHTHEKSRDEILLRDGRTFERYTSPMVGAQGKHYGRIWYFRDITAHKQAEEELLRQKTFLHQIVDTDPNLIYVKDAAGKFLMANQALANSCGTTVQKMIGKSDGEINVALKGLSGYLEPDIEAFKGRTDAMLAESSVTANGKRNWYLTIKKPLLQPDGSFNVLGIAVDISGQKLSEIKLAESYKELQQLAYHLENVREDERTRIARELHDEMGATLAALKMRAAWLASKLPPELAPLTEEAGLISGLVSEGVHTLRQIVSQLRPSLLEDVGLDAAIEDCVRQFRQNTHIECTLALPEEGLALENGQSAAIFRILQESLNNVTKHAQASKVDVIFSRRSNSLLMVVVDNGVGFVQKHKEQSFGLLGIRERALMAGGKAKISSARGKGTRVSVKLPAPSSSPSTQEYAVN